LFEALPTIRATLALTSRVSRLSKGRGIRSERLIVSISRQLFLEDGALVARIKFSRGSELAQRVVRDLEDGIQIPLSVGYKIHATHDDRSTVPVTRIATDWEPFEVSLVPIAAEETGTGFRHGVAA
jgi:hypothetical protein